MTTLRSHTGSKATQTSLFGRPALLGGWVSGSTGLVASSADMATSCPSRPPAVGHCDQLAHLGRTMVPMPLIRDEGVVLRTHKLGEADRIVSVLTRDRGRVRAVARGVRRTTSSFGARLEPLGHIDVPVPPAGTWKWSHRSRPSIPSAPGWPATMAVGPRVRQCWRPAND